MFDDVRRCSTNTRLFFNFGFEFLLLFPPSPPSPPSSPSSTPNTTGVTVSVHRAFEDTTTDIDIDEARHLLDYPVRLQEYRGSLYWSGNEGLDPDTKRPRGGTYGGPSRNGTWSAVVVNDVDMGQAQRMTVQVSAGKGTLSLARTDGLVFFTGR